MGIYMPPPPLVEVDFATEMIICICLGTRSSGGYGVEVKSVDDVGGDLIVKYETSSPSGMATMALTQPHHIVRVARSDKSVKFEGNAAPLPLRPSMFMLTFAESADPRSAMAKIK